MSKHNPIKSVPLTTLGRQPELIFKHSQLWVLKHRNANHPVASGVYISEDEALRDYNTIPGGRSSFCVAGEKTYCQGCGVGCFDEYEVVRITNKMKHFKVRKLNVQSV